LTHHHLAPQLTEEDVALSADVINALREIGLALPSPTKKNYEFSDLQGAGLVTDYAQLRRLRDRPPPAPRFPAGLWVGDNRHIWTFLEIGRYLLALRNWSEFRPWHKPRYKNTAVPIAAPTAMPVSTAMPASTVPPPDPPSAPIVSLSNTTKRRRQRRTEAADAGA
jgi:hypothetical protein